MRFLHLIRSDLPNQHGGMKHLYRTRKKPSMNRPRSIPRLTGKLTGNLFRNSHSLPRLRNLPPLQNLSSMQCLPLPQNLLYRMLC